MKKMNWKTVYVLGGGIALLSALFLVFSIGVYIGKKTGTQTGDTVSEASDPHGEAALDADPAREGSRPADADPASPGSDKADTDPAGPASPDTEPLFGAFTAKTLSGAEVTDADLANGKISLVNCFGTFCGPCIEEMPDLEKLSKELGGVSFFGVCTDLYGYDGALDAAQLTLAEQITETCGVTYPVIIPPPDLQQTTFDNIVALPCTYILGARGELLETVMGRQTYDEWSGILGKYTDN
ncbi:MAG: TlpA family protein disulfide reductase [Lachnospiraceae bacterium]|nr:TlpA family protein disulfide reductase [Lachnospiraceae bacterium]